MKRQPGSKYITTLEQDFRAQWRGALFQKCFNGGASTITNESAGGPRLGQDIFLDETTADRSTITNNGRSQAGQFGGQLHFRKTRLRQIA